MANSIVRWEPLREMMSLREAMDRLFEDSFLGPRWAPFWPTGDGGNLAIDMVETDDNFVVTSAVPGVKPEDVDISIIGDTLTIKGETKMEEKVEKANYVRQERRYGSFQRSVTLPMHVQADKSEATFENGVLTLRLPKAEEVRPKSIKITVK